MSIEFASSERSTLGLEWELQVVDRATGALAPAAPHVLEHARPQDDDEIERLTSELFTNTVEVVSGVHRTVGGAVDDLARTIEAVREVTDPMGLEVICSGTHPTARWQDQEVTQKERYVTLLDRTAHVGRQLLIWGLHMHVGLDAAAKALPVVEAMLTYYPHLQALSASSPFVFGEATGYASNRALLFEQLPTAGLPPRLDTWQEYEAAVADLTRVGVIEHWDEVRWDVRPSAKWGTVETRICDGPPTLLEVGAFAALVQCLVDDFSARLSAGEPLPVLQKVYVRENKWRAARYGMEAVAIVDRDGTERPVRDELEALVTRLEPIAERLGCAEQLQDVRVVLDGGSSAERQARVSAAAGADLDAVVPALIREMRAGRPLP
ncbi:glutamate--cysteine ligase [Amnibacterium endophyticum]|uniref:Putative glutamate--cysteine ligase 2 n=1 Tax=Amnibacterium endophyticum TaxID=2109337 RepID=A0ABW4LFC2_9MICO